MAKELQGRIEQDIFSPKDTRNYFVIGKKVYEKVDKKNVEVGYVEDNIAYFKKDGGIIGTVEYRRDLFSE